MIFISEETKLSHDERVEVVSILTPNFLHYEMARKLVEAGFHVICEKPMTLTAVEAQHLQGLVHDHKTVFLFDTYLHRISDGSADGRP